MKADGTRQEIGVTSLYKKDVTQKIIAPLGLVILVIVLSFLSPYFFSLENFFAIGRQAAINLIISIGMTVVILSAGIDLSVGSLCAISACTMSQIHLLANLNIWVAMIFGIMAGTFLGFMNGAIIHFGNVPPFVATLGMMGIARGAALIITRGYPSIGLPEDFQWIGAGYLFGLPFPFVLALLIMWFFSLILKFTELGRSFFAIGGNEEAARFSGIRVGYVKIAAYTISGLCSGIAGIVMASRVNSAPPAAGTGYELNAIAAVVIGGTNLFGGEGTLTGTLIGALIMAVIANGLNLLDVNPFWQILVIGCVVILAVMLSTVRQKEH
jgi:ribose transport system permease protein